MRQYLTEQDYEKEFYDTALPYLKERRTDSYFDSFDGKSIHYNLYRADNAKATITIFHGFTENIIKYQPMIYVFLNEGYNVAMCDQRGHGLSFRYVEDTSLTHIAYFDEYVQDMEVFVREIVLKTLNGPHVLFAHSMGGAIGALFLERNHGIFSRAVLSSPMIEPNHGRIPLAIGKLICGYFMLTGRSDHKLFISQDFSGYEDFNTSCATSRGRFDYYMNMKHDHVNLWNTNPTYRWTYESLKVRSAILKKGTPEAIDCPVLLFNAELDTMVLKEAQEAFISRVPDGRMEVISGAKHEIFRSTDDVVYPYLEKVLEFYRI